MVALPTLLCLEDSILGLVSTTWFLNLDAAHLVSKGGMARRGDQLDMDVSSADASALGFQPPLSIPLTVSYSNYSSK
jgi:hypothetical protein